MLQPSTRTNKSNLKGRATSIGLNIIIPKDIKTEATTISITKKGKNSNNRFEYREKAHNQYFLRKNVCFKKSFSKIKFKDRKNINGLFKKDESFIYSFWQVLCMKVEELIPDFLLTVINGAFLNDMSMKSVQTIKLPMQTNLER